MLWQAGTEPSVQGVIDDGKSRDADWGKPYGVIEQEWKKRWRWCELDRTGHLLCRTTKAQRRTLGKARWAFEIRSGATTETATCSTKSKY